MAHILLLPTEILHHILSYVNPEDLGALPLTCKGLNSFVKANKALYRDIYLRHLDDPQDKEVDWQSELHDIVKLTKLCRQNDHAEKKSHLEFVSAVVTRLLEHAARGGRRRVRSVTYPRSANVALLTRLFDTHENRVAFLSQSSLYGRARGEMDRLVKPPQREHQLSAKLHCKFGKPLLKHGRTRSSSMYPLACSKVYDLRQHSASSLWGPFMGDGSGRVDWEKVEAILLVLRSNVKSKGLDGFSIFANIWNKPFAGPWSGSYLLYPMVRELGPLDMADPYDVTGTWLRMVCFVDYNDFFTFNFPVGHDWADDVPRPPLSVGEATRLILMKIQVTNIEPPGEGDGQSLPVVHFKGISRSLDGSWDENANSDMRGCVRLTPEGEVRWTTFSIFSGEERWRSEGVQIGGPKSARGVAGYWFDKDYDPHGPCGPTSFWKISNCEPKGDIKKVSLEDYYPIVEGHQEFDELSSDYIDSGMVPEEEYLELITIDDDY